jgi:hypothetical protein
MHPLMLQGHVSRLRPYTQPILVAINMKTPDATLSILSVFIRTTSRMIPHGPRMLCNKGLRETSTLMFRLLVATEQRMRHCIKFLAAIPINTDSLGDMHWQY